RGGGSRLGAAHIFQGDTDGKSPVLAISVASLDDSRGEGGAGRVKGGAVAPVDSGGGIRPGGGAVGVDVGGQGGVGQRTPLGHGGDRHARGRHGGICHRDLAGGRGRGAAVVVDGDRQCVTAFIRVRVSGRCDAHLELAVLAGHHAGSIG